MVLYAKSVSEIQVAKEGSLFSLPSMSGFPSDIYVAAHFASPQPEMTDFVQDLAFNGEKFISVWPERSHVKNGYLESWRCKETQKDKKQLDGSSKDNAELPVDVEALDRGGDDQRPPS